MSNEAYDFLSDFINEGKYVECAADAHETWKKVKEEQGWKYGPKRDDEKKEHPFLKPFKELPEENKGLNALTPYAVVNYFRNNAEEMDLKQLEALFKEILDGGKDDLLDELSEYVHSHFIINLIAKGETTRTRRDMIVYEDLDEETQSWDTRIALDVIRYLRQWIQKEG